MASELDVLSWAFGLSNFFIQSSPRKPPRIAIFKPGASEKPPLCFVVREFFSSEVRVSLAAPRGDTGCQHLAGGLDKIPRLQKLSLDLRNNSVGPGPQCP